MHVLPEELEAQLSACFRRAGASAVAARSTASALVHAEVDGQPGHGLSRVPSYLAQLRSGKVDGAADPSVQRLKPGLLRVDAVNGFAYPAVDAVLEPLASAARENGIAAACIFRSHHFGQAGFHAERLAEHGLVALAFTNSPKGIAFWGGRDAMLGTNPIAFAAPAEGRPPLVIDLSLSVVARGKVMAAQRRGEGIPEGWALDADGQPTTDPDAALAGSMMPLGGAKGAALAFMVEVLAAALTGSAFGFEASSLFSAEGEPPNLGHTMIAIDPKTASGGSFTERMTTLLGAAEETEGARIPGDRRLAARKSAKENGVFVSPEVLALLG